MLEYKVELEIEGKDIETVCNKHGIKGWIVSKMNAILDRYESPTYTILFERDVLKNFGLENTYIPTKYKAEEDDS